MQSLQAFTTDEFRRRVAGTKRLMAEAGMDALLVLSEPNIFYLTGYEGFSDYVPQLALITANDDVPWLILREMDVACATPTCWLPDGHTVPYAEKFIGSRERTPWEPIADFIASKTKSRRLGVEFSAKGFGVKEHATLLHHLKIESFLDADGLVSKMKRIKSDQELKYINEAAKVVDRAMLRGVETIGVGVRQADVGATVMEALCAGTPEIPGSPGRPPTMAPQAPLANAPHLKWSDGPYVEGMQTNFEMGGFRHRYCCGLSRTVYLGKPPEKLTRTHAAVMDGFEAALAMIRPGNTTGSVADAFHKAFDPHGIRKESRIGYSIGIDWADGGATLQKGDTMVIEPNMMLHLIVGIWEPNDGYVFSETVQIDQTMGRSLTTVPRTLFVRPGT